MRCYALKNLTAQVVELCEPWKWTGRLLVPEKCILDKQERDAWACNPSTDYQIYSYCEGLNNSIRVSEANPPTYSHGIAGDYDLKIGETELYEGIARLKIKPNWIERTLSGQWRLHWIFERPIPIASVAFFVHIMERIHELIPIMEIPGLDRPALLSFSRYYTNGGDFRLVHTVPVSAELLEAFIMKESTGFGWDVKQDGPIITINQKIIDRLKERYPRFVEWEGEFKVGAQGPTFFAEGSTSHKSARVTDKGIYSWANHAPKPFSSWGDLLGHDWMKTYESNRVGNAVKDIYFDDKTFHIFSPVTQTWIAENKENVTNELLVNRGLSREFGKRTGSKHSEIEGALNYIRHNHRIAGAAPFAFYPKGLMEWNGARYLNTHTREVLPPAKTGTWGKDGEFPWLSEFFDQFFTSKDQLPFFLSWCARGYAGFHNRAPVSGQILFIAGPANSGKTFLNRAILGRLFGGYADPKKFLMGQTEFNWQLFDHGYWCMDDSSVGSYASLHRYFSEMLKVLAANRDMESHAKFGKPSQVAWQGRCGITCNDDTESMRLIPRLDISNLDKIMLFRAAARMIPFPPPEELEKILARELPFFARFLLEYQIPVECLDDDPRFGVKAYHEPTLVATAHHTDSAFNEILDHWMGEHFTVREPKADCWEGTALQLRQEILKDPTMVDTIRGFDLDDMKRRLTKLATGSLFHIEILNDDERRMKFKICRSTHHPKTIQEPAVIEAAPSSKFEKQ